jgi:hypothetical protein
MQRREIGLKRHAALAQSWPLSISRAAGPSFHGGGAGLGRREGRHMGEKGTN